MHPQQFLLKTLTTRIKVGNTEPLVRLERTSPEYKTGVINPYTIEACAGLEPTSWPINPGLQTFTVSPSRGSAPILPSGLSPEHYLIFEGKTGIEPATNAWKALMLPLHHFPKTPSISRSFTLDASICEVFQSQKLPDTRITAIPDFDFLRCSAPGGNRTRDPTVKSGLLYHLSYRGEQYF